MNENDFDQYLADIMSAVYGEEVRGSIRSALEILHNMLQDAQDGIYSIRDDAQSAASDAQDYAAQAMATTPEGYDTFAEAIADVISDTYIETFEINEIFTDDGYINITVPTESQGANEDPTYGSEGDGTEEP